MTAPYTPFTPDYERELGIGSEIDRREWELFLARRKQLLDTILQTSMSFDQTQRGLEQPRQIAMLDQQGAPQMLPPRRPPTMSERELIGQAQFWGIPNPESIPPDELYQMIEQRRQEMPQDEFADPGSRALLTFGAAAEAGGAVANLVGNVFGLVDKLPFAGSVLSKILKTEEAKRWMYDLGISTAAFVEGVRAAQPQEDQTAEQVALATGKVAGYALPGVLTYGALGSMAGVLPSGLRAASPIFRAAMQGGLTGAVLEAGSDEATEIKALNIGLGVFLGGATAVPVVGASLGLGLAGAGVGAQVGDTPGDRTRHAIEGFIGGALLGATPLFLAAATKVKRDMPGPFDQAVREQVRLLPSGPRRGRATVTDPAQPPQGPDFTVEDLMVRSDPPIETPESLLQQMEIPTNIRQSPRPVIEVVPSAEPQDMSIREAFDILTGRDPLMGAGRPTPPGMTIVMGQAATSAPAAPKLPGAWQGPRYAGPGVLQGTAVVDQDGSPITVYHGTAVDFEALDLSKADPDALFGPGFYHTESAQIASGYALEVDSQTPVRVGAQVRPARLNIQNPFDVDKQFSAAEVSQLIDQISELLPAYDFTTARGQLLRFSWEQLGSSTVATGENVYNVLADAPARSLSEPVLSRPPGPIEPVYIGKEQLNRALEQIGFDGITHIGGARTGNPPHRVWIAFRPDQVISPWDVPALDAAQAAAQGDAMAKQAAILSSPTLPQAAAVTQITDVDVVKAAAASNPGGISVIRGLNKPLDLLKAANAALEGKVVRMEDTEAPSMFAVVSRNTIPKEEPFRVTAFNRDPQEALVHYEAGATPEGIVDSTHQMIDEGWASGLYASNIRGEDIHYIMRDNKFDVLVGKVTDAQIVDYKATGVFTGQQVTTPAGVEGEIIKLDTVKKIATVRRAGGGPPVRVRTENLLPSTRSTGHSSLNADDLWAQFRLGLQDKINQELAALGAAPADGILDPRVSGLMHQELQDFLQQFDPAFRGPLEEELNYRWLDELRMFEPELNQVQDEALASAARLESEVVGSDLHEPIISIEELAEKRGFVWVAQPGEGGVLRNAVAPGSPDMAFQTDDAVLAFLQRVEQPLPDLTPISDVPLDVAKALPTELGRDPRLHLEDWAENIAGANAALADEIARLEAGGGGDGADIPPVPPGGGFAEGPPLLPEGERMTLGAQFARLQRADPRKLYQLLYEFQGLMSSRLRYTRYAMLGLERRLTEAGVDLGRAWQHYADLDQARHVAFNEGYPWVEEWSEIMQMFPRRALRDGSVTRFHEIEDLNARMGAWWRTQQTHGYSESQIKKALEGDERITSFMHRFFEFLTGDPAFALTADREIFRYMPHVRARQAQDHRDPFTADWLNPNFQFFAEYAREGNVQFRVMDARQLGTHMIRSAMFKKHEEAAWNQLVNAWQDPRVPESLRDFMLDYAKLSRYGYDPSGELAVRGVQGLMKRVLRVPVTPREAQHILNVPTGLMYMSLLAGRTAIFFRDAIQPLLALAKVQTPYMASTYKDILVGAGRKMARQEVDKLVEMYERGLQGGWIERENPNIEVAGLLEEGPEGGDVSLLSLTPEQAARRELLARIGDAAHRLPAWLARPTESRINTLRFYARQGQLHRMITGESAYRQAIDMLNEYRKAQLEAVLARDITKEMPYKTLADRAFFTSFEKPIQRRLQELVEQGDDEGAARLFAREVSNWSQHKYGRKEMPVAVRGTIGRMASMLGNFTGQFIEGMVSALANGTARQRLRFAMVVGGVSAAMWELKQLTGWSFDKWMWVPYAFEYAGSPLLETALTGIAAVGGAIARRQDRTPSPMQEAALAAASQGPGWALYFPYTGYVRTMSEFAAAAQGVNPFMQAARYTITGDRGSRPDMARMLEVYYRRNMQPPVPQGSFSPNGGTQPEASPSPFSARPPVQYPYGTPHPGAGAQQ